MEYIGIDLGDKRVGIALSRENIAFAQSIVPRVDIVIQLKKIFLRETHIHSIVVGLPYDLYGTDTKQLEKTQKFIEKLQNIFPEKEIIGHDERFSSFLTLQQTGEHRDDIAAAHILQSYIDMIHSKK